MRMDKEGYNAAIKAAGKIAEAKGKDLFMPIRVKITGTCTVLIWWAY